MITGDTQLDDLLDVAETAPAELSERMRRLPIDGRRALAERARQLGFEIAQTPEGLSHARRVLWIGALLYQECGALPPAVDCQLAACDLDKVLAETPAEYQVAAQRAESWADVARDLGEPSLVLRGLLIVAECSLFESQADEGADDRQQRDLCIARALARAVSASEVLGAASDRQREAFATLAAQLAGDGIKLSWSGHLDEDASHALRDHLRALALAVETYVPAGYVAAGGLDHAQYVSELLARLSYGYGSPDAGLSRLSAVLSWDTTSHSAGTLLHLAQVLYASESRSHRSPDRLHQQRLGLWTMVDHVRSLGLSRAARVNTAQRLDATLGQAILDEFKVLIGRNVEDCFTALEVNKSRILLDELKEHTRALNSPALIEQVMSREAKLLHLEAAPQPDQSLRREMSLLSRLPIGGLDDSPDATNVDGIRELEAIYQAEAAGFTGSANVASLQKIVASLQQGEGMLILHIPYNPLDPAGDLAMLLITEDGALPIHRRITDYFDNADAITGRIQVDGREPIDASSLSQLISLMRMAIRDGDDAQAEPFLRALYDEIIYPWADFGVIPKHFRRLIIVPHGPLHAVPFAALRDADGAYLAERVPTVVVPSASVWDHLRSQPLHAPQSFLGFADPWLTKAWEPLKSARSEVADAVSALTAIETQAFAGADATEQRFRDLAPGASLLHLATHGEFPEEDAIDLHRALLTASQGHDGRLYAEEVRSMDLAQVLLATLSICDGALSRFGPGDEQFGLVSAFLAAGVRNVVGPLWEVDDTRTARLMSEFYRCLLGSGPAEAMQSAQLAMIGAGEQIRDWAGFEVVGDGRPFAPDSTPFPGNYSAEQAPAQGD